LVYWFATVPWSHHLLLADVISCGIFAYLMIMQCQGSRRNSDCQNEGIVSVEFLDGPRWQCAECAQYAKICSEILEPIDRETIANLKKLSNG
jgi:hypothetical protein